MLDLLISTAVISIIIIAVNLLAQRENKESVKLFHRALTVIHICILIIGAGILPFFGDRFFSSPDVDKAALGGVVFLIGAWGTAVSLFPVRQWIAQRIPLNPYSPVHTLALLFSAYLVGNTAVALTQGGLAELAESTQAAGIGDVLANQIFFAALAIFGVGFLTRRQNWPVMQQRLGLYRLSWRQLWRGLRWIGVLILLQSLAGALQVVLNPQAAELLDAISGQLLGDIDTVWEWAILALATGVGEELLFRGALQPAFGLSATAVLFAVAHIQYGFSIITIMVFLIGVILGHLRQQENLTLTIFVHAGYNFSLGMLAMLATIAEQSLQ